MPKPMRSIVNQNVPPLMLYRMCKDFELAILTLAELKQSLKNFKRRIRKTAKRVKSSSDE
jgi:hypothetical protein